MVAPRNLTNKTDDIEVPTFLHDEEVTGSAQRSHYHIGDYPEGVMYESPSRRARSADRLTCEAAGRGSRCLISSVMLAFGRKYGIDTEVRGVRYFRY